MPVISGTVLHLVSWVCAEALCGLYLSGMGAADKWIREPDIPCGILSLYEYVHLCQETFSIFTKPWRMSLQCRVQAVPGETLAGHIQHHTQWPSSDATTMLQWRIQKGADEWARKNLGRPEGSLLLHVFFSSPRYVQYGDCNYNT